MNKKFVLCGERGGGRKKSVIKSAFAAQRNLARADFLITLGVQN